MVFKTLKMIFQEVFLTLNELNPFFVNCESVSVMTYFDVLLITYAWQTSIFKHQILPVGLYLGLLIDLR